MRGRIKEWMSRVWSTGYRPVPLISVVILYVATIAGLGYTHHQSNELAHQAARVERLMDQNCPDRRDAREASRVVALAVRTIIATTGQPMDYSQIPGYDDVEPGIKQFLVNLSATTDASGFRESALRELDRALQGLDPVICGTI